MHLQEFAARLEEVLRGGDGHLLSVRPAELLSQLEYRVDPYELLARSRPSSASCKGLISASRYAALFPHSEKLRGCPAQYHVATRAP